MKPVFGVLSAVIAAVLVVPAPLAAQTIPIPFAPPLDAPLRYRIEQQRPIQGSNYRFDATRSLRFERSGDGYILHARLDRIDTDAPATLAAPFRAALEPLVGVEVRFRLDADGRFLALEDGDAVWARVQGGVDAMAASTASDPDRHQGARNVQTLFASLSAEGRLSLLAGEVRPLLLFAGSSVEGGAGRGLRTVAGSPLTRPVPVEGALRVSDQAADTLALEERLAGGTVTVAIDYRLSRVTGLVDRQRRDLTTGGLSMTETRVLEPAK